jgi:hypothetical protein
MKFKFAPLLKQFEKKEIELKGKLLALEVRLHSLHSMQEALKNEEEACYDRMLYAQKCRNFKTYNDLELKVLEIKEALEKVPVEKETLFIEKETLKQKLASVSQDKKKWERIKKQAYDAWCKKQLRAEESY